MKLSKSDNRLDMEYGVIMKAIKSKRPIFNVIIKHVLKPYNNGEGIWCLESDILKAIDNKDSFIKVKNLVHYHKLTTNIKPVMSNVMKMFKETNYKLINTYIDKSIASKIEFISKHLLQYGGSKKYSIDLFIRMSKKFYTKRNCVDFSRYMTLFSVHDLVNFTSTTAYGVKLQRASVEKNNSITIGKALDILEAKAIHDRDK